MGPSNSFEVLGFPLLTKLEINLWPLIGYSFPSLMKLIAISHLHSLASAGTLYLTRYVPSS